MNYPECQRNDCRFQDMGGSITCVYNPIRYDKAGNPVGGGSNIVTSYVKCHTCGKIWCSKQSELERAQGKHVDWIISE